MSSSDSSVRSLVAIVFSVLFVGVSARFSIPVPGSPVPQSLQTLAVVLVGALLGARQGGLALVAYVTAGALGLPVFADGAAGASHLTGPTAGYLLGFVAGAALVGYWADGVAGSRHDGSVVIRDTAGRRPTPGSEVLGAFLAMCAAHVVILGAGWLRLAVAIGAGPAFTGGVTPFLWGGAAKSALGAVLWWAIRSAWPRSESRKAAATT